MKEDDRRWGKEVMARAGREMEVIGNAPAKAKKKERKSKRKTEGGRGRGRPTPAEARVGAGEDGYNETLTNTRGKENSHWRRDVLSQMERKSQTSIFGSHVDDKLHQTSHALRFMCMWVVEFFFFFFSLSLFISYIYRV